MDTLSVLAGAPAFIYLLFIATDKSAIKVSSVSPDLCDITVEYPLAFASLIAFRVSVNVPIWFGFIKILFATLFLIPFFNLDILVTNKSSPTSCILSPNLLVNSFHPSQSSSDKPSSIDIKNVN